MSQELDKVISAFAAIKSGDNEWKGTCPLCRRNCLIISVGTKQPVTGWCSRECSPKAAVTAAVFKAAGMESKSWEPFTVARFCELKKLPRAWVTEHFLVHDGVYKNPKTGKVSKHRFIRFPYLGEPVITRTATSEKMERPFGGFKTRFSESSHNTAWQEYSGPMLYGLHMLPYYLDNFISLDVVTICEGESDVITLAHGGIPAFGVPGAPHGWCKEFAQIPVLANARRILVVREPDGAGDKLISKVAADFPAGKVLALTLPVKDPSALWIENQDGFANVWAAAVKNAQPVKAPTKEENKAQWRDFFRDPNTLAEGDVKEFIEHILPEGCSLIGSNSGVGKTWLAISMLKALTSGKPFLGIFPVLEIKKCLYLIPEVGDRSLRRRLERMRVPLDGDMFRVRTMADGIMRLNDEMLLAAVREWKPVIFLDTAIRFTKVKDENSSAENATLAEAIFALLGAGACAVVGLHHSPKSTANADELTLENVLRGTGDLGAMCDTVWGVQHDRGGPNAPDEYLQESRDLTRLFLKNVKPRDLDAAEPFVIQGRPYIDELGDFVVLTGDQEYPDKNDAATRKLVELVSKNPKISKTALAKEVGIDRHRLEELLEAKSWRWKSTSRTTGIWELNGHAPIMQTHAPEITNEQPF